MKTTEFRVALMLGGNLGATANYFREATMLLNERVGSTECLSAIYSSEPWGKKDQPVFKNQAIVLITSLTPDEILLEIQSVEQELGRIRREKNGPREIDIDILLFDNQSYDTQDLVIPHPRLHLRNFNLVPLAEIAPDWVHPVLNKTIRELMEMSPDTLKVYKNGL